MKLFRNKSWEKIMIVSGILFCIAVCLLIYAVFFSGFGERGWSEGVHISIDDSSIVKIGAIDDTSVYTYDMEEVYFLHISAKEMRLDEFIKNDWVDAENLLKGEKESIAVNGQTIDVYLSENYKIIHADEMIIYTPLQADESKVIEEAKEAE